MPEPKPNNGRIRFDNTITVGNILSFIILVVCVIISYAALDGRVAANKEAVAAQTERNKQFVLREVNLGDQALVLSKLDDITRRLAIIENAVLRVERDATK